MNQDDEIAWSDRIQIHAKSAISTIHLNIKNITPDSSYESLHYVIIATPMNLKFHLNDRLWFTIHNINDFFLENVMI